jgi:hypothetical protein
MDVRHKRYVAGRDIEDPAQHRSQRGMCGDEARTIDRRAADIGSSPFLVVKPVDGLGVDRAVKIDVLKANVVQRGRQMMPCARAARMA